MNDTNKISFSGNFLSKSDKKLSLLDFKEILTEAEVTEIEEDNVHIYSLDFEDHYLKISVSDGSIFPRNPHVINVKTTKIEPNPRNLNQIEPTEFYVLIDFDSSFLWISNGNKKNLVLNFFSKKFKNSKFIIKDVYDQELFLESIKRIDELRITATPDLFSKTNTITTALSDEINQYEAVEAILHLKYQDKFVGNTLIDKIKSIISNKNNFRGIMIAGRDEHNNGILFNTKMISKKIGFHAYVDQNGMFSSNEIFKILIDKIEDEKL
ncbi:MAG: hypothetical protein WD059_06490 [Balneolaceae bacterium]